MNTGKLFWGSILLILGLLLLLTNFQLIQVDWKYLLELWPLIFVFWGISLLPNKIKAVGAGFGVVLLIVLVFNAVQRSENNSGQGLSWEWNIESDETEEGEDEEEWSENETEEISEKLSPGVNKAHLQMDIAAGEYELKSASSGKALELNYSPSDRIFNLRRNTEDSIDYFEITASSSRTKIEGSEVTLLLSEALIWNLDLRIGASEAELDFSPFKIEELKMGVGASDVEVKIGDKNEITNIEVAAGVSDFELNIPKESGCRIKIESGFASKDFEDFEDLGVGVYQTSNFNSAENKIMIDFEAGIADIDVNRY